jgi:hypothetical protein
MDLKKFSSRSMLGFETKIKYAIHRRQHQRQRRHILHTH